MNKEVEQSNPQNISVLELLAALIERGQDDDAFNIQYELVLAAIRADCEPELLLMLPVDEYIEKHSPPPQLTIPEPRGWDRVYYGNAAFSKGDGE